MNNKIFHRGVLKYIPIFLITFLFTFQDYSLGKDNAENKNEKIETISINDKNAGVLVLRRFFKENSEGNILISISPCGVKNRHIENISLSSSVETKILDAMREDSQAPDAALDTEDLLSTERYWFTIQLDGRAYSIIIGCDSEGLNMGQGQYRWKSPKLAKELRRVFEKEGWMKGKNGKYLSGALDSMVTGGGFSDYSKSLRKINRKPEGKIQNIIFAFNPAEFSRDNIYDISQKDNMIDREFRIPVDNGLVGTDCEDFYGTLGSGVGKPPVDWKYPYIRIKTDKDTYILRLKQKSISEVLAKDDENGRILFFLDSGPKEPSTRLRSEKLTRSIIKAIKTNPDLVQQLKLVSKEVVEKASTSK